MQFEWDQAKSDACFLERGFDFAYAASAFADPNRIVRQDTRHVYGETRYQLIGRIDNRVFILVYTPRHDVIRIISARKVRVPAKWPAMKIVRRTLDVNHPTAKPVGRINRRRVDATTESDIAAHKAADDC